VNVNQLSDAICNDKKNVTVSFEILLEQVHSRCCRDEDQLSQCGFHVRYAVARDQIYHAVELKKIVKLPLGNLYDDMWKNCLYFITDILCPEDFCYGDINLRNRNGVCTGHQIKPNHPNVITSPPLPTKYPG
jgi:hypothetical protein